MATEYVKYPFGRADKPSVAFAAVMALAINNDRVLANMGTMTANGTLNLTVNPDAGDGAELVITVPNDATARTLTFGTGFSVGTPALVGTVSKTNIVTAILINGVYVVTGVRLIN